MTYALTVEQKPTYLHVVITGRNNPENVEQYVADVFRECRARGCWKVLIEERLEGPRLGALEIFAIVSRGSARYVGLATAIAYVDVNAVGDTMQFAEDVAVNRAMPVKVFRSVDEAERWLLR